MWMRYGGAVLLCIIFAWRCEAQEAYRANWFPFVIPDLADDEASESAIDLSFLNSSPAGSRGVLRIDGERIVDHEGSEVRLFGTNICDYHAMPPKENAPRIAKRLKQLGFNFIRLHFFDWAKAPHGILTDDMQTLNAEKLDQFDYLVACLKENGIYVDINLHVCRPYVHQPAEIERFGKGIDFIHQPYIESQKQYARDLIGHRNPYTKLTYAQDPAVAIIELNNENTVFKVWNILADLPAEFSAPITARWNEWLIKRYNKTAALKAAWNGATRLGDELLANGSFSGNGKGWTFETHAPGTANAAYPADQQGNYLRWEVGQKGREPWHIQFYARDMPVKHGRTYTLTFRARCVKADRARISVGLLLQQEPWGNAGGPVTVSLSEQWKEYAATWTVFNPKEIPVRLNFSCLSEPGTYDIAAVSLREGERPGLAAGQQIEQKNIPLVNDTSCPARTADYISFLMDEEAAYVVQMKKVLREELGSKAIVYCSQASYSGMAGLKREVDTGDMVDMHCYPCHPSWKNDRDGKSTLIVNNESMVAAAFGDIEKTAFWRYRGKPFVITEFDLNPPNDHASENFPLLALMASYQGWAGFSEYSWYNFQNGKQGHSSIISHFATTGHPGQMCMIPSMALLYRQQMIKPAVQDAVLYYPVTEIAKRQASNIRYGMDEILTDQKVDFTQAWRGRVATRFIANGNIQFSGHASDTGTNKHIISDTGEIRFDRANAGAEFLQVSAPAIRMLIGYVGGREFTLGDVTLSVVKSTGRNYANLSLVALDGKPINNSRKLLLTAVARVENSGQRWNEDRTSTGNGFGDGTTLAEPVCVSLTLPGKEWRASPLDGKGRRMENIVMRNSILRIDGTKPSLWYLIER